MIDDTKSQVLKGRKSQKRMTSCFARIERFAQTWEAYFDVIGIFVSTHPEWCGLFWGVLRLVFLVEAFQEQHEMRLTRLAGQSSLCYLLRENHRHF